MSRTDNTLEETRSEHYGGFTLKISVIPHLQTLRVKQQSAALDIRVKCHSAALDIRVKCQSAALDITVKTQIPTPQAIARHTNGPTVMVTLSNLKIKSWRNPLPILLFFANFNSRHLWRTVSASNLPMNETTQNAYATGERHTAQHAHGAGTS
jgi:hypothetical protein